MAMFEIWSQIITSKLKKIYYEIFSKQNHSKTVIALTNSGN